MIVIGSLVGKPNEPKNIHLLHFVCSDWGSVFKWDDVCIIVYRNESFISSIDAVLIH